MRLPASIKAFGITRALDYLERDPDANLPRLMEWVDKYTEERLSQAYRELFHKAMTDPENNWHRLIKSMYTDIDNRVLKKIFENFVIHGGLLEWPERSAAGKLNQEDAPWSVLIDPSFPCSMDCAGCGASIYGVRPSLEFDSMDEAVERRKAQGCHLFIVSSGDPLAKEQEAIALCNKHSDCVFAAFTPPPVHHRTAVCGSAAGVQPVPRHPGGCGSPGRQAGGGAAAAVPAALRGGLRLHGGQRRPGGHQDIL